ncbi:hypothetical protein F8M41_007158 [Gigaspora margarita]|uniref:Uncharacterized protein n=1 Tax=Gigaspora margarita TaxID=4874 RepID=A0A8H4ERB7_GIGMA|nr:hypothetical protein F8M41_007158 [Gigaspora margarita]
MFDFDTGKCVCIYILIIPIVILTFLCPALEISKLSVFDQTNGELVYNVWVEYAYLALTMSTIVGIYIFYSCLLVIEKLSWYFLAVACCWLIFPFVYTYFTLNEMNGIPFLCPSDYPYKTDLIFGACKIRTANLFCMWIYFLLLTMMLPLGWSIIRKLRLVPDTQVAQP